MPPSSFLNLKPPSLLRVSESQAISNSSSFRSSTSSSSLFDRLSGASSGCLTEFSSPFTPSTAEFGNGEGEAQPSDSPTKEQATPASKWDQHDRALFSPQSRLPRRTNVSLINRSSRLDRACALGSRSFARSFSQNGTPFVSLIPVPVAINEDRRYYPDSEDSFDAVTILKNRLERANPTVATRRALEFMDPDGHPPAASLNEGAGGFVEAPVTVVVTSPVEDWSGDFEFGSAEDKEVFPESSPDINTIIDQFSNSESDLDEDWLEIAAAHSSIVFPSTSDLGLLDETEQDIVFSPMFIEPFFKKPVLGPVTLDSPCSPFILGTPDLKSGLESSFSSLSTCMAASPTSPTFSPANVSLDEEEMARIMHTLLSVPTRTRQPFSGSPEANIDVATVMRLEIASTFSADNPHLHASQTRTLIGLGVALPAIYPPPPPTLFPLHHPPGATINSRSLRELGYPSFDDKMFEIERTSLAVLSRNVNKPGLPENVETDLSGLGFEINESYFPLEGCTALTPTLPEVDFECSDAFQVEQALSLAHTPLNHMSSISSGKALVGLGLGLGDLTDASIECQPPLSPTTERDYLVSADESVTEVEVAAPLPVTDFNLQIHNSLVFEPLGAQISLELDASQLERQSALYNLEHAELVLDHIFSYSPPIRIEKRTEIERELLAGLFKNDTYSPSQSQPHIHSPPFSSPLPQNYSDPCTLMTNNYVELKQPRSVKQLGVLNERKFFSKKSFQALKKLGLERLAIFQTRSGRNDLDLTTPIVAPQDDPRSPCLSTLERVFLTFTSMNPPCETHSHDTTSTGLDIKQSSGSVLPMDEELPKSEDSKSNRRIGLGLPSQLALRRSQLQETSSSTQASTKAVRSQSSCYSQGCQNPSVVVTQPSFASSSSCSRVGSAESSNQFLKPSHFAPRPLYDIIEVPTPPSSTSSFSPRGTPSPRNQWSSPFTRINAPQKRQSFRSQLSTPSTGTPPTESSIHADTEVEVSSVVSSAEVSMPTSSPARSGFKQFVSKLTRDLFKRSRPSLKTSDLVQSPVLIEHTDAPFGIGIFRQDKHGASCGTQDSGDEPTLSISIHKLRLLF